MASFDIHAFLIHPGRNIPSPPAVTGKKLTGTGKLFDLLANIFHASTEAGGFEVSFLHASDGTQQNDCRDLLIAVQQNPTLANARAIANRLQKATDNRSGIGLFFVMTGQHGSKKRTVLSRFPANEAILAEIDDAGLEVELLEQVFIRQLSAYKALLIEDVEPTDSYWSGLAIDRQAGGAAENISEYWLDDFLTAEFSDKPKAGTQRLAEALRKAAKATTNLSVKGEIASAVSLAPNALQGQAVSVDSFCVHFGLSKDAADAVRKQLKKPSLSSKTFVFDAAEFKKRVPYRSVELENGAILKAPSNEFDDVFDVDYGQDGTVTYSTSGRIADQRMTLR